jgi:glucose/arabinose dehydrogenase
VTPREGYAVPKDNPYVGVKGARPEIWALGLRNPWRFSFDRETGLLYAGDVGQDRWEEVNVIEKGGNYGWHIREGAHELHPVDKPAKMTDPIFEYSHDGTAASITGGCVYRGKKIPALRGWYLCGDYSTGRIYGVKYENGRTVASGALIDPHDPARSYGLRATQPSSFGEDADGEIFLCDVNGPVYRVVGAEAAGKPAG